MNTASTFHVGELYRPSTFHFDVLREEVLEVRETKSGSRTIRRTHGEPILLPCSTRPPTGQPSPRPIGWYRSKPVFAVFYQGALRELWIYDSHRVIFNAIEIECAISDVFKICAIAGETLLVMTRDATGRQGIVLIEVSSGRTSRYQSIVGRLLDATLSDPHGCLLSLGYDFFNKCFGLYATHLDGDGCSTLIARYDREMQAPYFSTSSGFNGLLFATNGPVLQLLDPMSQETRYEWDREEASIGDVVLDASTGRPWAWSSTARAGKQWWIDSGMEISPKRVKELSGLDRYCRLSLAPPGNAGALLQDAGFKRTGETLQLLRSGDIRPLTFSSNPKYLEFSAVRTSILPTKIAGGYWFSSEETEQKETAVDAPIVLLLHGGPSTFDDNSADPWVSALLRAGAAVVKANYPGSYGCGRSLFRQNTPWKHSEFLEWLRNLLDELAPQNDVGHRTKVFLGGWSFGGYLALHAAAHFSERVDGAFAISTPFNIGDVILQAPPQWKFSVDFLEDCFGQTFEKSFFQRVPSIDRETLSKCRRLLIAFGSNDNRIGLNDSFREMLRNAASMEHVLVREFDSMGHFLNDSAYKSEVISLIVRHIFT